MKNTYTKIKPDQIKSNKINKLQFKSSKWIRFDKIKPGDLVLLGILRVKVKRFGKYLPSFSLGRRARDKNRGYARNCTISLFIGRCLKIGGNKSNKMLKLRDYVGREGYTYNFRIDAPNFIFAQNRYIFRRGHRWRHIFKFRQLWYRRIRQTKKYHLARLRRHGDL